MRPTYWIALVLAGLGWASGGIATRAALGEGVDEWTMVAVRVPLAAALVGVLMLVRKAGRPSAAVVRYGLVQAVFNLTVPYVLVTFALGNASAGFVALLTAMIPLATATFANFMLPDEPLTLPKVGALFVAMSGVMFLLLSGDSGLSEGGRPLVAAVLALCAVASIGYANSFAKRHADEYEPLTMTGLQFAFASVWLLAAMFAIEGAPTDVSGIGWALIVFMAIFSTFMPFVIYYWLLQRVSATTTSLVGYLVPLFGLVGGIVILGEELQPGMVAGGALVLVGVVLADRASRSGDDSAVEATAAEPRPDRV